MESMILNFSGYLDVRVGFVYTGCDWFALEEVEDSDGSIVSFSGPTQVLLHQQKAIGAVAT